MTGSPTYGVDDKDASFSGKRINVVYDRCSNGMILNADCTINVESDPDIWKDTEDLMYGFHKQPKGIPRQRDSGNALIDIFWSEMGSRCHFHRNYCTAWEVIHRNRT